MYTVLVYNRSDLYFWNRPDYGFICIWSVSAKFSPFTDFLYRFKWVANREMDALKIPDNSIL